jgi:hypothetical protein
VGGHRWDKTLSQPALWASAAKRAFDAILEPQRLREEWIEMRMNFVDEWTVQRDEYVAALDELVRLQRMYAGWEQPDSLSHGKVQEMLDDVASIPCEALREEIPDLKEIRDPIRKFDADTAWGYLDLARAVRPPKGWGRDYNPELSTDRGVKSIQLLPPIT